MNDHSLECDQGRRLRVGGFRQGEWLARFLSIVLSLQGVNPRERIALVHTVHQLSYTTQQLATKCSMSLMSEMCEMCEDRTNDESQRGCLV
jgi:hypothetical protein